MKKHFLRTAAAALSLLLLLPAAPVPVLAASSAEIQSQINELEAEAAEIAAKRAELQDQIDENAYQEADTIYRKSLIDQEMTITREEIANTMAQIEQYEQLIAEKEAELEEAEEEEAALYEQYEDRIRAMEENGSVTYWSILFKASSFSDLLDRMDMIHEIARADQAMMDELNAAAEGIIAAEDELLASQAAVEEQRQLLAEQEAELEAQSAEAQALIDELKAQGEELAAAEQAEEEALYEMYAEIAEAQKQYEAALAAEWAAQAQQNQGQGGTGSGAGTGSGGTTQAPVGGSVSFMYPCSYVYVSSPYGNRYHPETGEYHFHGGVDFAANSGTPVYATASGTVSVASYNQWNGNYVSIAHSGGYSSMYLHLTSYTVSPGTYVSQGQVIGYVGSTGTSTGPHLDFRILYNGATVNPLDYLG